MCTQNWSYLSPGASVLIKYALYQAIFKLKYYIYREQNVEKIKLHFGKTSWWINIPSCLTVKQ